MILKRIAPGSAFKVGGAIYAAIGLIVGVIVASVSLLGTSFVGAAVKSARFAGLFFGVGAIVFFPIFYGLLGAVMAALMAWVYNSVVGLTGGLRSISSDLPPDNGCGGKAPPGHAMSSLTPGLLGLLSVALLAQAPASGAELMKPREPGDPPPRLASAPARLRSRVADDQL